MSLLPRRRKRSLREWGALGEGHELAGGAECDERRLQNCGIVGTLETGGDIVWQVTKFDFFFPLARGPRTVGVCRCCKGERDGLLGGHRGGTAFQEREEELNSLK